MTTAALALSAAAFPSMASAEDVPDTLSPWCIASYCEGYVGDPGAAACANLTQEACLASQSCWWRDTTVQNALAESAATDFGGQLLHPYSGSFSGNALDIWVWNSLEGTNVILVVSGTQYFQIGCGVSDMVRDEALAAFQAGIPDFETLTAYSYLYNTAEPGVDGSTWDSSGTIPTYVAQTWPTERTIRNLALTAHAARSAQIHGAGLFWGPDGFLGDGTMYDWDLSAATSPQKPNSVASMTSTTSLTMNGLPIFLLPTGLEAGITMYLPAQKILIPGWPFSTHFPDIAPLDRAPLDPYNVVRAMNTCIALNPNNVIPQYGPPVIGSTNSLAMLTAQRDAVNYVHTETLRRMNLGEDVDTVAATLALPSNLADSPWNQQVATTVPGVVRAIYALRLGWYSGVPADLAVKGLAPADQAERLANVGGTSALLKAARAALEEQTDAGTRWATWAAHEVMVADPEGDALAAKCLYWNAMRRLAFSTSSARERNLFLSEIATLGDLTGDCGADDDADGTPNWLDCSPGDAGVNTGADEICDGKDNDCNGAVDDGIQSIGTVCGTGACTTAGLRSCVGGEMVDNCRPGEVAPEACDGIDNDCNGTDDDGITPVTTTCGQGACEAAGSIDCVGGTWVTNCVPGTPSPEVCDNIDNDCNDMVDDGIPSVPTVCGIGACVATGEWTCGNGGLVDSCVSGSPSLEICDNVDNDCNDTVDDIAPVPTTCGTGACVAIGEWMCSNGHLVDSCVPGTPSLELCDEIDNDCNGLIDDGITPVPTTCGVGACLASGEWTCVGGGLVDSCVSGAPSIELCDDVDNDCNDMIDDGIPPVPSTCGTGACVATGEWTCVGGSIMDSCVSGTPSVEVCDNIDNDCNDIVDDEIPPVPTTCGIGACVATGTMSCGNGRLFDSCMAGTPEATDATCNGIDEDCDGQMDQGYVPATCGIGACASTSHCTAGAVQTCVPGNPAPEVQDGIDNNCNGIVDEGTSCTANSQCATGYCVDGVCCTSACGDGLTGDCMACSVAAGAALNGTCGPAAKATTCRAAVGGCDTAETCDGASTACPADTFKVSGTTCRAAAGTCDVAEKCTGKSATCPVDAFKTAGTTCRAAAGNCDVAEKCLGSTATCPTNIFLRNNTPCGYNKTCINGSCVKH
jgi:hypothetical protein